LKDPHPQPPLPDPLDQTGAPPFKDKIDRKTAAWPMDGYGVPWKTDGVHVTDAGAEGDNLHVFVDEPKGTDDTVPLVVMHCECEGSRICFVCQALKPFLDALTGQIPGVPFNPGEACHAVAKWLPWPIDKIVDAVCSIVEDIIALPILLALAPAIAAALAAAWEAAQAFDDLFVTGPVARQIHVGDVVIVNGRWVWDAGHSGHTELHPVTSIQKLQAPPLTLPAEARPPGPTYDPREHLDPAVASRLRATYQEWCRLVSEPPPPPDPRTAGVLSGPQLAALTAEQRALYERQQLPENSWEVHPMLDGCRPRHEPPPPPPPPR
jgi:hypothetical protein